MDAAASHIWQSTVFAVAAGMLTLMFRTNSAAVRYWIWFAAAMKFLVPFAVLRSVGDLFPLTPIAGGVLEAGAVVFRSSPLPAMYGPPSMVLAVAWVSGSITVLWLWMVQWRRVAADVRRSEAITSGVVHDALRRMERLEGITRPTALVESSRSLEPGVFGLRTPVFIWPRHLATGLNDAQVEAIVAHEMCHIVRRDNLLGSAQLAVSAVFWFHPLVWWMGARLVDERERACDERVLARGSCPATYAQSILKTCELCIASPLVNVAGVTGGNLKSRITRIMKNATPAPLSLGKKAALAIAALLTILIPSMGNRSGSIAAAASQNPDREVHRPGGSVVAPKLIRETKPQYSERAKQEKVQGEVQMECVVRADGTVGDKKVVKPLHPDLDQAALDAAGQWLFEPGTRDGKPVAVLVTIAMTFTLK